MRSRLESRYSGRDDPDPGPGRVFEVIPVPVPAGFKVIPARFRRGRDANGHLGRALAPVEGPELWLVYTGARLWAIHKGRPLKSPIRVFPNHSLPGRPFSQLFESDQQGAGVKRWWKFRIEIKLGGPEINFNIT